MFGSVFRSILVIGTIYALSPVKLDATAVPSAQASTSKAASAGPASANQKSDPSIMPSVQSAAIAMVTGINPLASGQSADSKGHPNKDQIGDLIALGKDVCLANPGLCAEVARTAATSVARKNIGPQQGGQATVQAPSQPSSQAPSSAQSQPQAVPQRQTAHMADSQKGSNKGKPQSTSASQPDLLGVLIEKVAPPAAKTPSEKMVAKAQR